MEMYRTLKKHSLISPVYHAQHNVHSSKVCHHLSWRHCIQSSKFISSNYFILGGGRKRVSLVQKIPSSTSILPLLLPRKRIIRCSMSTIHLANKQQISTTFSLQISFEILESELFGINEQRKIVWTLIISQNWQKEKIQINV